MTRAEEPFHNTFQLKILGRQRKEKYENLQQKNMNSIIKENS